MLCQCLPLAWHQVHSRWNIFPPLECCLSLSGCSCFIISSDNVLHLIWNRISDHHSDDLIQPFILMTYHTLDWVEDSTLFLLGGRQPSKSFKRTYRVYCFSTVCQVNTQRLLFSNRVYSFTTASTNFSSFSLLLDCKLVSNTFLLFHTIQHTHRPPSRERCDQ